MRLSLEIILYYPQSIVLYMYYNFPAICERKKIGNEVSVSWRRWQDRYDLVIVGAGLSGGVIAERASSQLGMSYVYSRVQWF